MTTRQKIAEQWLEAERSREDFSQWALESAPLGAATLDLVDVAALLILARRAKIHTFDYGLPREAVSRLLDGIKAGLPAEHQVWIETMERAYDAYIESFSKAEDE